MLIAVLGISCSNDDVTIESVEHVPSHTVTFNVATHALYDTFGISNGMKNQILNSDNLELGVFTYIYDSSGVRVDSSFAHTNTFSSITQQFVLGEGTYSIISVETVVNKNYSYKPDSWNMINTENLSTCEIRMKDMPLWYECVGAARGSLTIEKEASYTLTPSPLGALVDVNYFNFDKSNYKVIAFITKNEPSGIKLNPYLKDDNRYTWDSYNKENFWALRGEDHNKEKLKDEGGYTLYLMEDGRIQCGLAPITLDEEGDLNSFAIYPSNTYYLTIQQGKWYYGGLNYKGGQEGSDCEIYLGDSYDNYLNWKNKITPPGPDDLYYAPYTTWGGTVSAVKSHMKDFTLSSDIQIGSNGLYWMAYYGTGNVLMYEYDFKTATNGLERIYVYLDQNKVTYSSIDAYLKKCGYTYSEKNDDMYLYENNDTYTFVWNSSDIGWIVAYMFKDSTPNGLTFKEPCTKWGASVSTVKSYMNGYTLRTDITQSDDNYYMMYDGKDDETAYEYDFTSRTTGLNRALVAFNAEEVTIENLTSYFKNSSTYDELIDFSQYGYDGVWATSSTDGLTFVTLMNNSGLWIIIYTEMSQTDVKKQLPSYWDKIQLIQRMPKRQKKSSIFKGNIMMNFSLPLFEKQKERQEGKRQTVSFKTIGKHLKSNNLRIIK